MPFCVAYTREKLEMVMDAHIKAIAFYGAERVNDFETLPVRI